MFCERVVKAILMMYYMGYMTVLLKKNELEVPMKKNSLKESYMAGGFLTLLGNF